MPPPLPSSSIGTIATRRTTASLLPRCLSSSPATSTTSTPPFASPCARTPSTQSWRPTTCSSAPSGPPRRFYSAGIEHLGLSLPADYVPPTQPPSARRPEVRKSQLLRTYTHMLRTTPLALIFQHNNLTAVEWAAVRRELNKALKAVPVPQVAEGMPAPVDVAGNIQLQVIRTRMFAVAMKVVEFFDSASVAPTGPKGKVYNHDLSRAAFEAMKEVSADGAEIPETSTYAELAPLMVGPLALLTFPAVSPAHLAAALSILAPSAPQFPAPKRSKNPGYFDPLVQNALPKMLLVGGRIEGKVFDTDGVKWVGGIEGGMESLRAQLVYMLQSAGMGLTTALEGASKSLWLTMESRRSVLEEEQNGGEKKEQNDGEKKEEQT